MNKYIKTTENLRDIYPKEWNDTLTMNNTDIFEYRNLQHFKNHVSSITQINDDTCDISYKDALKDLVQGNATMSQGDYEIIKNKVKNNLLKRGLISDTIYESYKYEVEGDIIDVARLAAEDPACCLVPNNKYDNHFYELYISISYPWQITNETVVENMAKILATIELLEQEHYYCKLTLVFPDKDCNNGSGNSNFLGLVPLFSYKDIKNIETMSSVLNDRLLRKFFFAVIEEQYGTDLDGGYGTPVDLPHTIKPVDLCEEELASNILNQILEPSTR